MDQMMNRNISNQDVVSRNISGSQVLQWTFSEMVHVFSGVNSRLLLEGKWGLEKEAQRVCTSGELALTPHPSVFGDKLENPHITTDFSESQIEIRTSPFDSVEEAHEDLLKLNLQVEEALEGEMLWPLSMPPKLPSDEEIPVARFGDSPEGKERGIYRSGLALRYGKKMQMICGIHDNFSFGAGMLDVLYEVFGSGRRMRDFTDEVYFAVTRNFLRYRWLLIYLFGASPCFDATYDSVFLREWELIGNCCAKLRLLPANYGQYATSFRVSRFGYSSAVQGKNTVYFNHLQEYSMNIRKLLFTTDEAFTKLGIYRNGEQVQLNGNILQKENEFYSSIRVKADAHGDETQLEALEKRGVKYLEIRLLDLNPFEKTGVGLDQLRFMQVFLLFCLFESSEYTSKREMGAMNVNHHLVSLLGRKENLELYQYGEGPVTLRKWAEEIFEKLYIIAVLMDAAAGSKTGGPQHSGRQPDRHQHGSKAGESRKYQACVEEAHAKVVNPSLLLSARICQEMKERGESFLEFGIRRALALKKDGAIFIS